MAQTDHHKSSAQWRTLLSCVAAMLATAATFDARHVSGKEPLGRTVSNPLSAEQGFPVEIEPPPTWDGVPSLGAVHPLHAFCGFHATCWRRWPGSPPPCLHCPLPQPIITSFRYSPKKSLRLSQTRFQRLPPVERFSPTRLASTLHIARRAGSGTMP